MSTDLSKPTPVLTSIGPCQYVLTDYQPCLQYFYTQELKLGAFFSESRVQDVQNCAESWSLTALVYLVMLYTELVHI